MSLEQGQVPLLNDNNQAEIWAVAEAFSQLQKSPCPCLTSPVAGGGWGACILLQQHCSVRAAVSRGIQETLNPSNCSWPQSIILAKAKSCICFSETEHELSVPCAKRLVLLNSQTQTSSAAQTCSDRNPMHKKIPPRQVPPRCSFC